LRRLYNQRARAELIIRELKYAYALGKIPTKDFHAKEVFFQIVLLAYNLLPLRSSPSATSKPATLAARLFVVPSQLVRPGAVPTVRIAPGYLTRPTFFPHCSKKLAILLRAVSFIFHAGLRLNSSRMRRVILISGAEYAANWANHE